MFDEWDATADIIGAWQDDKLVGCVRINYRDTTDLAEYEPLFHPIAKKTGKISVASKLVVTTALRGTSLGVRLCQAAYAQTHQRGSQLSYLTCRTNLVEMYRRFGWRICGPGVFHPEAGWVLPMVLLVQDYEYLQQIRSPFAPICAQYPVNEKQVRLLRAICVNEAVAQCA